MNLLIFIFIFLCYLSLLISLTSFLVFQALPKYLGILCLLRYLKIHAVFKAALQV